MEKRVFFLHQDEQDESVDIALRAKTSTQITHRTAISLIAGLPLVTMWPMKAEGNPLLIRLGVSTFMSMLRRTLVSEFFESLNMQRVAHNINLILDTVDTIIDGVHLVRYWGGEGYEGISAGQPISHRVSHIAACKSCHPTFNRGLKGTCVSFEGTVSALWSRYDNSTTRTLHLGGLTLNVRFYWRPHTVVKIYDAHGPHNQIPELVVDSRWPHMRTGTILKLGSGITSRGRVHLHFVFGLYRIEVIAVQLGKLLCQ